MLREGVGVDVAVNDGVAEVLGVGETEGDAPPAPLLVGDSVGETEGDAAAPPLVGVRVGEPEGEAAGPPLEGDGEGV